MPFGFGIFLLTVTYVGCTQTSMWSFHLNCKLYDGSAVILPDFLDAYGAVVGKGSFNSLF